MSAQADVYAALKRGRVLTNYDGFTEFNVTRMGDVIHQLRKKGIAIETREVKRNGKRYAEYRMGSK